ncbi:hypothetical protein CANARDRAFT_25891 [[Candida] arabinofermentans NRRL YB-2248]|uniref:3'(2'),5'-bisphosphate nucleotidase n=1 Tax=[Candida] arabinofermentans NRRL YB-2248 TaxID=983967 RepID=A0A1E4T7B9_9ASCO|nr:hypothetical protein CANARDRAFT_25891 [[Candida] arabinofermentans NRRL YB-2248]
MSSSSTSTSTPYLKEAHIAQLAVKRASILTQKICDEHLNNKGISKSDSSPVTIGDFGAQAIIINSILNNFKNDEVVGEEDSELIKKQEGLKDVIFKHVEYVQNVDFENSKILSDLKTSDELCESIDKGNSLGGKNGRIWALDPIDGTKGFLRGDQYAICLALMVDGIVQVGVIGCPNLPHDINDPNSKKGGLFTSVRGVGSFFQDLDQDLIYPFTNSEKIQLNNNADFNIARVVEGVEKGHSSHDLQSLIKQNLNIKSKSVNLDSQVKYCAVSKGDAEIYLRLPKDLKYREKIWDHAAGYLLIIEAGGVVSDIYGNDLDFGFGRTLNSQGVIASTKTLHAGIIKAIKSIIGENGEDLEKFT